MSDHKTSSSSSFGFSRSWFHRLDGKGKPANPTIKPTPGFSATADAERVHRAIKGLGTDEDALINILANRTNHERQEICSSYQSLYNKSLKDDLKGDTSGQFKTILCELVQDLPYTLAKSLYYATKGAGTNERVLIEILSTLWNEEVQAVSKAYKKVLENKNIKDEGRTLESDIAGDTGSDFGYALQVLIQGQRDDIPMLQLKAVEKEGIQKVVGKELAADDAKELYEVAAGRIGTNEKRLTRVICGRTPFQLNADVEAYKEKYGRSLIDDLKKELSRDYEALMVTIVRYAIDRPALIAEWFHDALAGLGTRDYTIMRLLISRSELDLEDVKRAYEATYGEKLSDAVRGDTSGDYQKTLLKLLGESA